jgi:ADP-heptose:LPS heptosyltransferase
MNQTDLNSSDETAEHLAAECLSELRNSSPYPREQVARLARLATADDEQAAREATSAIFAALIEPLADSFDTRDVTLYNRLFSQLIQACRSLKLGRDLDRDLNSCGLGSEEKLLARVERVIGGADLTVSDGNPIERAVVLSRVTLGADVAISSVIIERLKQRFPGAEIVLVGGRQTPELFGGDSKLSFREIHYQRAGTLAERLSAWKNLLDSVESAVAGLERSSYLIVDPDSRLTQLGLFPVLRGRSQEPTSVFFPSRSYGGATQASLAELASAWSDSSLGVADGRPVLPRLWLNRKDVEAAAALARLLRRAGSRPIVSINFGVGENPAKSVGGWFEAALVSSLLADGATIILDRGAGENEGMRADSIASYLRDATARVAELNEEKMPEVLGRESLDVDLLVLNGRIGLLASLIGQSDLYIGYDSAGQHIAAALGVPCIDVMAGYSSERMAQRWRPTGPSEVRVILVGGSILEETMQHVREMLAGTALK